MIARSTLAAALRGGCLVFFSIGVLGACTATALRKSSVAVGSSVTDLQYQIVLDNIAMFRDAQRQPNKVLNILPWHAKITQGSISVNDTVTPSFMITAPNVSRQAQISFDRAWSESWTLVPEVDPVKLFRLRSLYVCIALDEQFEDYFGEGSSAPGSLSGRYRATTVWIKTDHLSTLTDITLAVLAAAPTTAAERPVAMIAGEPALVEDVKPTVVSIACPKGGLLAALATWNASNLDSFFEAKP